MAEGHEVIEEQTLGTPHQPLGSIGKYQLLFELGRGGMATVLLAVTRGPAGFNKLQVLKLLNADLAREEEFLSMFLEEARLSARLNHPNIAQTNEVGNEGDKHFIAMEYLDGQSMEDVFRREESRHIGLPIEISLHILIHALAGLHYAHELVDYQGKPLHVVHRDVSPQNIFITYEGQVKILDFGIAKAANSKVETRSGVIKGKIAYMPAEQLGGESRVDRRADIFAIGAVLWRSLAGERLWKGMGDIDIFRKLIEDQIPLPSTVREGVDPELEAICMRALAGDVDMRYPTAAEFQTVLEDYVEKHNKRASARTVGEHLRSRFAERRNKIKAAIEARLDDASSDVSIGTAGVPMLATVVSTVTTNRTNGQDVSSSSSSVTDNSSSTIATRGFTAKHSALARWAAGAMALAVVVAAGVLFLKPHAPPAAPPALAEPPASALQTRTDPAPSDPRNGGPVAPSAPEALTTLNIRVSPKTARLQLDDVALPSNPWTGQAPRDGATHRLSIDAPGYIARVEKLVFNEPAVDVNLALDRPGMAPRPDRAGRQPPTSRDDASRSAQPTVTPPQPPAAAAPTSTTGKPKLDRGDPWKN